MNQEPVTPQFNQPQPVQQPATPMVQGITPQEEQEIQGVEQQLTQQFQADGINPQEREYMAQVEQTLRAIAQDQDLTQVLQPATPQMPQQQDMSALLQFGAPMSAPPALQETIDALSKTTRTPVSFADINPANYEAPEETPLIKVKQYGSDKVDYLPLLEKYKGKDIVMMGNNVAVYDPKEESLFVVGLDDTKLVGNRAIMEEYNNVESAKDYIDLSGEMKNKNVIEGELAQDAPVYYHGTQNPQDILEKGFDLSRAGEGAGTPSMYGKGVYLSNDPERAKDYGEPMAVSLGQANLKTIDATDLISTLFGKDTNYGDPDLISKKILNEGYDGLKIVNPETKAEEIVIYKPELAQPQQAPQTTKTFIKPDGTLEHNNPPKGLPVSVDDKKTLRDLGFDSSAMGYNTIANLWYVGDEPIVAYRFGEGDSLEGISVRKDLQRQGIGQAFLKSMAEDGKIRVQSPNQDMLNMMNKLGEVKDLDYEDIYELTLKPNLEQPPQDKYYHGTNKNIKGELQPSTDESASYGKGIYLSDNLDIAKEYGKNVIEVQANIKPRTINEAERQNIVELFGDEQKNYINSLLGNEYNALRIPERSGDGYEIVVYDKSLVNKLTPQDTQVQEAPATDQPLLEEAKKYKSYDDFLKGINVPYYASWKGEKDPRADELMSKFKNYGFHGTNASDKIAEQGFKKTDYYNSGVYFAKTPDTALIYMQQQRSKDKGTDDVFVVPMNQLKIKEIPYKEFREINKGGGGEELIAKLKKQKYDGIKYDEEMFGETLVWNTDKLNKLKRETLADIYNQAHKK